MYDPDPIDVVASIAEHLAFLTPVDVVAGTQAPAIEMVVATRFSERSASLDGSLSGEVVLGLSPGLPQIIAGNMLGSQDTSHSQETIRDAAFEVVNVLAGNMLPRLFGSNREFILSTPFQKLTLPATRIPLCMLATEEGVLVVVLAEPTSP